MGGTILVALVWALFVIAFAGVIILALTVKIWLGFILRWLTSHQIFFDEIPEPFATGYTSGGKFFALACSQKGFGAVRAPGNLDWAIRKIGDEDDWAEYTDAQGKKHEKGKHTYSAEDFYWDRRPWYIRLVFGDNTGIAWKGLPPLVESAEYNLRITNFRTVKPTVEELAKKEGSADPYMIDGKAIGWLVSWNERTSRVLLSDDIYAIKVEGGRIGVKIKEEQKQQAVSAKILVFIRARIQEPYLFLYRGEEVFELIQNELIQHIRELLAGFTIEDTYSLKATLQSDKANQKNKILKTNDFGAYMRDRYGFAIKGASFGAIEIEGDAGKALAEPFIAEQRARVAAISGRGEGEAESTRLRLEGAAFDEVRKNIGPELAALLRDADVAGQFAASGKSSTVVLGMDFVREGVLRLTGGDKPPITVPTREEEKDVRTEPKPPKQ